MVVDFRVVKHLRLHSPSINPGVNSCNESHHHRPPTNLSTTQLSVELHRGLRGEATGMLKLKVSILALDAPSGNTQRSLDTGTFYQVWIWLWWLEESHSSRLAIPEWKTRCFLPVLLPCSAHIIISWAFFSCAQAENTAITCIMALPLESAIYGFFACFGTSFAVCTLDLLAWELGGQDHYKALALVCIAICSKLEEHVSYRTLGLRRAPWCTTLCHYLAGSFSQRRYNLQSHCPPRQYRTVHSH